MRRQLQEMMVWGVNPRKVLFGTDWPISTMESYVAFMKELKLPAEDRRRIMYANAAELFKIPVLASATDLSSLFSGSRLPVGLGTRARRHSSLCSKACLAARK